MSNRNEQRFKKFSREILRQLKRYGYLPREMQQRFKDVLGRMGLDKKEVAKKPDLEANHKASIEAHRVRILKEVKEKSERRSMQAELREIKARQEKENDYFRQKAERDSRQNFEKIREKEKSKADERDFDVELEI